MNRASKLLSERLLTHLHARFQPPISLKFRSRWKSRGGDAAIRQCDALFREARVLIEPVTQEQALLARQGYSDYGKGRHPAGLNLGDCFSYALAKVTGEPLLFKGDDFRQTDIQPVLP